MNEKEWNQETTLTQEDAGIAALAESLREAGERPDGFWRMQRAAIQERIQESEQRASLRLAWAGTLALVAVAFVAHSLIPADDGSGSAVVVEETGGGELADGDSSDSSQGAVGVRQALSELSGGTPARDPFSVRTKAAPATVVQVEKAPPPDLVETIRLTALWTQRGETYALINDRICRVGDKLGRLTVETAARPR